MEDTQYTAKDIIVLTDREHVRKRTNVYVGSTNPAKYNILMLDTPGINIEEIELVPAIYKTIGEIIDNSLDEFCQITKRNKLLRIVADPLNGVYTIGDNGRGVPIGLHATGKYTPEVVFGSLRSGRNFDDDTKQSGVIGMNGVGSSITNYCSKKFTVFIQRDNKTYYQTFSNGAENISTPQIKKHVSKETGTEIKFELDPEVFQDVSLPEQLIRNRAIEIALNNPDIVVEYNNTKYHYPKGFNDVISSIANDKLHYRFDINENNVKGEIFVIFNATDTLDEQMFTWVNSSLLFDGGKCNTQFFNSFFERVIGHLDKEAKKIKTEVTRNDVRQGILVLASLKIKNPEYDSQSKTRLTGPDLRKEFNINIENQWKSFSKVANTWFSEVLERAHERHHKQANKKAVDDHSKKNRRKIDGLLDATSSDRAKCSLLISEGLSAKSSISEARVPAYTAAFALTGKVNNVYGCTPAQVLAMGKLTELLTVIGLTPGKKALRPFLHYGRIVVATDADEDGNDIMTLLVNLFYQFWPDLFDPNQPPIIYRLIAPNVIAAKGNKRIHFPSRNEYEKVKEKYKGWNITYCKGLGSMEKIDWQMILNEDNDCYIPIIANDDFKESLSMLFGNDANSRREWLMLK